MKDNDFLPSAKPYNLTKERIARTGLRSSQYSTASLEEAQIDPDVKTYLAKFCLNINRFLNKGAGLYLYGDGSAGKSYSAAAVCLFLAGKGYSCFFVTADVLTDAFRRKDLDFDGAQTILERANSCHVLVIDSLGSEYKDKSGYNSSQMYSLLQKRLQRSYASNIITSKLSPIGRNHSSPPDTQVRYGPSMHDVIEQYHYFLNLTGDVEIDDGDGLEGLFQQ